MNRLVGSRSTRAVEQTRAEMAFWWFVRVYTPAWLDLAGFTGHAESLRTVPQSNEPALTEPSFTAWRAMIALENATKDVYPVPEMELPPSLAAGRAAYRAANPNSTARRPALESALDAAFNTAVYAGRLAAVTLSWPVSPNNDWTNLQHDTIREALNPTIQTLQQSAHDLFNDMIGVADRH